MAAVSKFNDLSTCPTNCVTISMQGYLVNTRQLQEQSCNTRI